MASESENPLSLAWTRSAGRHSDVVRVAGIMAVTWRAIDGALRPLIGERGVTAIYRRSHFLASRRHPWLGGLLEARESGADDVAALQDALARQHCADATAAGGVLLGAFYVLLAGLVGTSLADRLLEPVRESLARGAPEEDASS